MSNTDEKKLSELTKKTGDLYKDVLSFSKWRRQCIIAHILRIIISICFVVLFIYLIGQQGRYTDMIELDQQGKEALEAANYAEALEKLTKAAEAGSADAYWRIGEMHEFGRGVDKDYDRAFSYYHMAMELYQKAADKGNVSAVNNIGCMYSEGKGVKKDGAEAVIWFRKAAEKTAASGVRQRLCNFLFRKATERGAVAGMANLGHCYLMGIGITQSYSEALYWLKKSAKEGCADAMNDLGYMYDYGYGVDYNRSEAIQWYKKAAAKGHEQAKENLRKLGVSY